MERRARLLDVTADGVREAVRNHLCEFMRPPAGSSTGPPKGDGDRDGDGESGSAGDGGGGSNGGGGNGKGTDAGAFTSTCIFGPESGMARFEGEDGWTARQV